MKQKASGGERKAGGPRPTRSGSQSESEERPISPRREQDEARLKDSGPSTLPPGEGLDIYIYFKLYYYYYYYYYCYYYYYYYYYYYLFAAYIVCMGGRHDHGVVMND
jgi:hypothetical protein